MPHESRSWASVITGSGGILAAVFFKRRAQAARMPPLLEMPCSPDSSAEETIASAFTTRNSLPPHFIVLLKRFNPQHLANQVSCPGLIFLSPPFHKGFSL